MEIRTGTKDEITNFQLYCEENDGDDILVAEVEGKVVGYVQYTTGEELSIYFIESEHKGAGTALIAALKEDNWHLVAVNVEKTATGFYEKMGFEMAGGNGWAGQFNMEWYDED